MATSPVITAPSAPSMSNFDQIGAALSEPEPSQAGTETAAPQEAQPETDTQVEAEIVSEPADQSVENADATAQPEPEPENPYERDPDAELPPQTLNEILKTPRGKEIYASHKTLREIAKPIDQGGIGHVPTVEQAREYFGAYRDLALMNDDLSSGNPQQAERLIAHLLNPQRGDGAHVVARQLGPTLAKSNPAAYEAAAEPFITNYGNELWNRYEAATNPELKQALYLAAQLVNKDFTGKYREVKTGATPQPQQADPLAQERAELEAQRAEITQFQQQQSQAAERQWTNNLNSKIRESVDAELDKALSAVKGHYQNAPKIYDALKKEFHDLVRAGANKDKAAWDIFQVRVAQAKRSGSPDAIDGVVKQYIALATPVIRANRQKFIEEAGVSVKQASDAKHAELRSIDSHKTPSSSGSPVKPSAGAPIQRAPGESQSAFNLRLLRT